MRYQQYKFKFYLNARHAIYINGRLGDVHPHTWEIILHVTKLKSGFIKFGEVEKQIEEFVDSYQSKTLNDVEPFDKINPTLENCARYFKDRIQVILNANGWVLLMLEISETPARTYVLNLMDEQDSYADQNISTLTDMILDEINNGVED